MSAAAVVAGPKITKKATGNRGAEGAEGGGVWGGGVPLPTGGGVNFLIFFICKL